MKKYFLLFATIFLGCERVVNIDVPKYSQKPVLNCLFTQDSIFKVNLTKTIGVFDDDVPIIDNASVKLYEGGVLNEELTFNGYAYTSKLRPDPTKQYRIEVETPEFESFSATDYLPQKPNLISANFKDFVYTDEEGGNMSQAQIVIKDNVNEKNYYELLVLIKKSFDYTFTPYFDILNNDVVILNEDILSYYPEYLVFSDELFNGKRYNLKINYRTPIDSEDEKYELTFYLRQITENYYNYKKRLIIHLYNQNGDVWDGVGSPLPMFSNIIGGYGIFAGYSQIKMEVKNE